MLPYFWQLKDKREGINAVITSLPLRMIIDMTIFHYLKLMPGMSSLQNA